MGAGDISQKTECWPKMYKALGGVLSSVIHSCNPGTQEVEVGGWKIQGHSKVALLGKVLANKPENVGSNL